MGSSCTAETDSFAYALGKFYIEVAYVLGKFLAKVAYVLGKFCIFAADFKQVMV